VFLSGTLVFYSVPPARQSPIGQDAGADVETANVKWGIKGGMANHIGLDRQGADASSARLVDCANKAKELAVMRLAKGLARRAGQIAKRPDRKLL
jgi:hypothetical protein